MKIEVTPDGYVDAFVMRHELNGLSAGLFTALEVLRTDTPDIYSAHRLLAMSTDRLSQITSKLKSNEFASGMKK